MRWPRRPALHPHQMLDRRGLLVAQGLGALAHDGRVLRLDLLLGDDALLPVLLLLLLAELGVDGLDLLAVPPEPLGDLVDEGFGVVVDLAVTVVKVNIL